MNTRYCMCIMQAPKDLTIQRPLICRGVNGRLRVVRIYPTSEVIHRAEQVLPMWDRNATTPKGFHLIDTTVVNCIQDSPEFYPINTQREFLRAVRDSLIPHIPKNAFLLFAHPIDVSAKSKTVAKTQGARAYHRVAARCWSMTGRVYSPSAVRPYTYGGA